MIYGNWVAIRKFFVKFLPDDREYTPFEAVFSVSLDFDSGNPASYSGYSKLWKWSRNKVKRFMNDDLELTILKPETPEEIRLQRGKIKGHPKGQPQDTLDDKKGQPLFVFNKALHDAMDNLSDKKGHRKDTLKDTTIDPFKIPNPKDKSKKVFDNDSREMKISKFFFKVLKKSRPEQNEPNWQNWCKDIDLFLRKMNPTDDEIKKVLIYAHDPANATDKFSWIPNLRSPKKLREHFEKILLTANSQKLNPVVDDGSTAAQKRIEETQRMLNGE